MIQSHKTSFSSDKRMLDLLNENYALLLFLQHFKVDFAVDSKTVGKICSEYQIDQEAFILIGNLYNGFYPDEAIISQLTSITGIISFLKNCHSFYLDDKYPELSEYIHALKNSQNQRDIELVEMFFQDYFQEVKEHLQYEDKVAFPYFSSLLNEPGQSLKGGFSVAEYQNHHTDIETKLTDLKNLFLKHLHIRNELNIKRKFLNTLFGLEFDLKIHSMIEEKILIPVVARIEKEQNG